MTMDNNNNNRTTAVEIIYHLDNKNFAKVRRLVSQEPQILWKPVRSFGATIMHHVTKSLVLEQYAGNMPLSSTTNSSSRTGAVAAATAAGFQQQQQQNLYLFRQPWMMQRGSANTNTIDMWQWLLQQAATASPESFTRAHDRAGETVLDYFWGAWLSPSPARQKSFPFLQDMVQAIETVVNDPIMLKGVLVVDSLLLAEASSSEASPRRLLSLVNVSQVVKVARFWRALTLLCQAASFLPPLVYLSLTGSCPAPVAQLVVALAPHSQLCSGLGVYYNNKSTVLCRQPLSARKSLRNKKRLKPDRYYDAQKQQYLEKEDDEEEPCSKLLPLHLWAVSPNPSDPDHNGLLPSLLRAYPKAAMMGAAPDGRLPLHTALEHGKLLHDIALLWQMAPETLAVHDPLQPDLPPVALLVQACRKQSLRSKRDVQKRNPNVSLAEWLDTSRDGGERRNKAVDSEHLTHIYSMLRADPLVLAMGGRETVS